MQALSDPPTRHRFLLWLSALVFFGMTGVMPLSAGGYSEQDDRAALATVAREMAGRKLLSVATQAPTQLRIALVHGGPRCFSTAFARDQDSVFVSSLTSITLGQAIVSYAKTSETGGSWGLTLRVRDNLRWSDGSVLNAADWAEAIRDVYIPESARSVFAPELEAIGLIQADALDPTTIRLSGHGTLSPLGLRTLARLPPFPIKQFRSWLLLGQKGSLGTGQRAPSEYRMFQFLDSKAEALLSSGPYKVESLSPGRSVVLVANPHWIQDEDAPETSVSIPVLKCTFLPDAQAALVSFSRGELDVLPLHDDIPLPEVQVAHRPHVRDWTPSTRVLCLVVNPERATRQGWLAGLLNANIDRHRLMRLSATGLGIPTIALETSWFKSASANTTTLPISEPLDLWFHGSRKARDKQGEFIVASLEKKGLAVLAKPRNFTEILVGIRFQGVWDVALVELDEKVPDVAVNNGSHPVQTVVPLIRSLRFLWALPEIGPLPVELNQCLLAYDMSLYYY